VEFNSDLLAGLECPACHETQPVFQSLGTVREADGRCPRCAQNRVPKTFHTVDGSENFLDRTLAQIGVPRWDIVSGRCGMNVRHYEFLGDARAVLGDLLP
jgi:adenylyltransferase/sulfurtransferase